MRLTRTAIGLLTAQYRSVLRKCFLINVGLYALLAPAASLTTATAVAVTAMPNVAQAATGTQHVVAAGETVDKIDETFSGNTVNVSGGFIYNLGTVGQVIANLTGNTINYSGNGSLVFSNSGVFDTINVNALNNVYNNTANSYTEGVIALMFGSKLKHLYGSYINNSSTNSVSSGNVYWVHGGAFGNFHSSITEDVNATFIGNSVISNGITYAGGGAVKNEGKITLLNGNWINNFAKAQTASAQGGAIWNTSTIGSIGAANDKALFIGNYAQSESGKADGGAIYNSGTISGDINADFIGNHVEQHQATFSSQNSNWGGAIYNAGDMGNISGNFINNGITTTGGDYQSLGGAIANHHKDNGELSSIKTISGIFIGNYVNTNHGAGGAITNYQGKIAAIDADFIGNTVHNQNVGYSEGGAISSGGTGSAIGSIKGSFINNLAETSSTSEVSTSNEGVGGAINNGYGSAITSIEADFIGNKASSTSSMAKGGAISNDYTISNITADFINNSATSTSGRVFGGAIYNKGTISNVTGEFKGNSIDGNVDSYGGAIYNEGVINIKNSYFNSNKANRNISKTGYGGAILNAAGGVITITDTSFNNNSVYGDAADIRNNGGTMSINAINKDVMFSNPSFTEGFDSNPYRSVSNVFLGTLNLNSITNRKLIMNGGLTGGGYGVHGTTNINQGSTNIGGEYVFNNMLDENIINLYNNADVRFGNVRQYDGKATYGYLNAHSTTVDSTGATMNFANANADQTQNFGALTLDGNLKLGLDSGEKIAASSATGEGSILFDYINYAGTPAGNQISWTYADSGNAVINKVANSTATVNTPYQTFTGAAVKNGNQMNVTLSNAEENLAGFLHNNTTDTSYDISRDEQMLVDIDTMAGTTKTVNANGHNIIGNQHAGVTLADGQTLTINDANVEGFYKEGAGDSAYGGAILGDGTVNLNNSTFRNNYIKGTEYGAVGGAVAAEVVKAVDSSFYNNSATGGHYMSRGGAIHTERDGLEVYARTKDSVFEGNYAEDFGGAIYTKASTIKGENGHRVIFSNNEAYTYGGAVVTRWGSHTLENVDFLYNTATGLGGGLYLEGGSKDTITDALFKGNSVTYYAGANGGAIYVDDTSSASISNSTFENNTATSQGGAIYNAGTIGEFDADEKPVEGKGIINTTFKGNMTSKGGAIYNAADAKISQIKESTFDGNIATEGGAIYNAGSITTLKSDFVNNIAESADGSSEGGALYLSNGSNIGNIIGNYVNNMAIGNYAYGGAILTQSSGSTTITKEIGLVDANFINNMVKTQATGSAGAFYVNSGTKIDSIKGLFSGNRVISSSETSDALRGGAMFIMNSEIGSIESDFMDNGLINTTGYSYGGAFINYHKSIENIGSADKKVEFTNNFAESKGNAQGGAIYNTGTIGNTEINNTGIRNASFTGNYAMASGSGAAYGGAIYNEGEITSIGTASNHAKFEENYAQANTGDALGGAIFNTGVIDNIYADFTNNKTESVSGYANGGAIYNTGTIKNVTGRFEDNSYLAETNEVNGGAVWNQGKIKVTDSIFSNNKGRAGGAFMNMNGGLVIIKNSQFIDNSALYGGALYNNGGDSIMHIENSTIKNNKSGSKNSFMEASGQLIIANSEIYNNSGLGGTLEVGNGGRVGETNLKTTLIDTNFTNNSGTSYAAIAISGAYESKPTVNIIANLEDVLFRNNAYNAGYIDIRSSTESTNQINLNASTGKSIDFGGMITGTGTLNINKSGLTYTDLKDDGTFETETKNITQAGGDYIFRNQVSGQTMNLYDGANVQMRKLIQADGTTSYGKLHLTGMTVTGAGNILDTRNGVVEYSYDEPITSPTASPVLGTVTLNNDLIWRLDVDLTQGWGNSGDDFGWNTTLTGSGNVIIDTINVLNDGTLDKVVVAAPGNRNKVQLASNYQTFSQDYKNKYTVQYDEWVQNPTYTYGVLKFTDNGTNIFNLVGYLSNADSLSTTPYDMTSDEPVLRNIGVMTGTTKTVNAGDYRIEGNGFAGVTVGANQTLNINGGIWDGFTQNVMWTDGKNEININNAKFVNNKSTGSTGLVIDTSNSYIDEGFDKINITDSEISNNDAIYYVLNLPSDENKITADQSNVIFTNNKSGGGVIASPQLTLEAKNKDIIFENNTGRAIRNYIRENSSSTISATGGDVIFKNNEAGTEGGAIYNEGTLDISGENGHKVVFEGNSSVNTHSRSWGGAIYNASGGHITNIDADFIGNYADAQGGDRLSGGGAILNLGSNESETNIDSIRGTFKNNYLLGEHGRGAAIGNYNNGTIGDIEGIFTGNYVEVSQGIGGGAIWTEHGSTINFIKGEFENNHVYSKGSQGQVSRADSAAGGAISNSGWQEGSTNTIGSIDGSFRNNYAKSESIRAMGGAISNLAHLYLTPEISMISSITSIGSSSEKATFENNYAESVGLNAYGGGIANDFGKIGSINADFTGNYAKSTGEYKAGAGGMVISGDTTDNVGSGRAYGGAIFNLAQVTKDDSGNITGVVENTGVIDSISGNFKDNYVYSENGPAAGAAIYNEYGTIGQIGSADNKALFEGNKIYNIGTGFGMAGATEGGTIYNVKGTIGDIYADFTNNFGKAPDITAGTALSNFDGSVGNIVGNFTDNEMENSENGHGTLNNRAFSSVASITSIVGNFINNSIKTNKDGYGGAIMNYKITGDAANIAHIGTIEGTFENNGVTAERYVKGGAIANLDNDASVLTAVIDSVSGTFKNNYIIATGTELVEAFGGAIFNTDLISNIQNSSFVGNSVRGSTGKVYGGAIKNDGTIGTLDGDSKLLADNTGIINTSFEGNYVRGNDESAGGAIYNSGNINLSALQSDVNFWNNKANDRYNDIYNSGTMNFNADQNKTMSFGGSIEGTGAININTGATNGGTYVFKSDVSAGNVVVGSADSGYAPASLSFEKATQEDGSITNGTFDVASLTINGDGNSLSTRNDKVDTNSATTLTLNNALNLQIDGDLQSGKGDSLAVSNLTAAAPKSLRLTAMNFTTDPDVTTLSKTDTVDVNITGENDILAQNNAYTLASTNPDDTTEEQIEQAYLNNLTSSSRNYNKTYAFRSAKLMTSGNNQTYVQYGDAITLKWLYENYINGWSGGNYIKNNVEDGDDPDSTHLTVGQALTALDSALGKNTTYDFSTQSVADVLVNNYYTKLMKKDEKFDTNEGIMDVKSLKKDTNSSQGRIIKGVSAFPSIMCAYPFDMPHTANDNHKSVILGVCDSQNQRISANSNDSAEILWSSHRMTGKESIKMTENATTTQQVA